MKTMIVYTLSWVVILLVAWLMVSEAMRVQASGPDADFKDSATSISYDQLVDGFGYGVITVDGETLIVPAEFAQGYLPLSWCESRYESSAVGALGELGTTQILPSNFPWMRRLGWNPYIEHDRLEFSVYYWRFARWQPWSCARMVGL